MEIQISLQCKRLLIRHFIFFTSTGYKLRQNKMKVVRNLTLQFANRFRLYEHLLQKEIIVLISVFVLTFEGQFKDL